MKQEKKKRKRIIAVSPYIHHRFKKPEDHCPDGWRGKKEKETPAPASGRPRKNKKNHQPPTKGERNFHLFRGKGRADHLNFIKAGGKKRRSPLISSLRRGKEKEKSAVNTPLP